MRNLILSTGLNVNLRDFVSQDPDRHQCVFTSRVSDPELDPHWIRILKVPGSGPKSAFEMQIRIQILI